MEKNHPPISVVIPVHNGAPTLGRVLDALAPGLTDSDQLIVADDGSTDGSVDLARSRGAKVIRNQGPPGAAAARNAGAAAATGEWILFIDSDAVAPDGWRSRLDAAILESPSAVQATYAPDTVGDDAATFYKNFYYNYTFTRRIRARYIKGCGTFFFAVRTDLFRELGGFDDRIPGAAVEDADFAARLTGSGGRILMEPGIEVLHLRRYTLRQLMLYEWRMMRSKVLYLLRRDRDHGTPSVSMASPGEMLPTMAGAAGIWAIPAGLLLMLAGLDWGIWPVLAGGLTVTASHAPFWLGCVRTGGWRGFRAIWITFPDLALILPASLHALITRVTGKKY